MNFVKFVDHRYQEVVLSMGLGKFNARKDAESNGLQMLLMVYRFFMGIAFMPKIVGHFFLVNLGWSREPRPALDEMKAQAIANERVGKKMAEEIAKQSFPNVKKFTGKPDGAA